MEKMTASRLLLCAAALMALSGILMAVCGHFVCAPCLFADVISLALDGVVLCFAAAYLKQELADGTPFTASGAKSLLRLGILTIALPLISAAVSCVIFGAFDVDISGDYGNGSAIIVGIVLILSSLVFSYGAELEGAKAG